MAVKTTHLGGSASDVVVAKVGHGLMMMTWVRPTPVPDDQCFEAIIAGIDQLPPGSKMFINSGEFYGPNNGTGNLELLQRFFTKYPEYADKTFLSVKGGARPNQMIPDCSPENVRRSVDAINAALGGTKHMDLFECARVDKNFSIEEIMQTLVGLQKEGKFSHIGLSECNAETVKRAVKVGPVAAVEIEISPWAWEEETKQVIATCEELKIAVVGYSPVGRGFLTGQIRKPEDLPEGDGRRHFPRMAPENFDNNFKVVDALTEIANKKGITPAQLAIAWVSALGPHVMPLPGSSHKSRKLENLAGGDVELTKQEMAEIDAAVEKAAVQGNRYPEMGMKHAWG